MIWQIVHAQFKFATMFYKLFTLFLAVSLYDMYFTGSLNSQSVGK